jgi:hypothetical protein
MTSAPADASNGGNSLHRRTMSDKEGVLQSFIVNPATSMAIIIPDFLSTVNLKYVKLGYHYLITHAMILLFVPIVVLTMAEGWRVGSDDIRKLWENLHFSLVFNSVLRHFNITNFIDFRIHQVDVSKVSVQFNMMISRRLLFAWSDFVRLVLIFSMIRHFISTSNSKLESNLMAHLIFKEIHH